MMKMPARRSSRSDSASSTKTKEEERACRRRIRLRRMGAKKRPFYRVVVADQRSPRDGRFIENIGKYHPLEDPSLIEIDEERALHWLRVGAQPSEPGPQPDGRRSGIWDKFVAERPERRRPGARSATEKPDEPKLSKKAAAKAAAEAEEAAGARRRAARRPPPRQPPSRSREPEPRAAQPSRSRAEAEPEAAEAEARRRRAERRAPPRRRRPRREGARGVPRARARRRPRLRRGHRVAQTTAAR